MENLIFYLKKRYSVNYWETCSPCAPFGGYGSALSSLVDAIGDFREKISLRTRVINCFECNVKHELPNFDIHLH